MDPCVLKVGDRLILWYCGMLEGKYRILRATSNDGIHWTKQDEPVLPLGSDGQFDALHHAGPCVLQVGDAFVMFYLGSNGKKWTVGLATSTDGVQWAKSSANPVLDAGPEGAWDGGSILGVEVLWLDGRLHVWYAAHSLADAGKEESEQTIRIGYATSAGRVGQASKPDNGSTNVRLESLTYAAARKLQEQWAGRLGREVVHVNSLGMKMVLIPPGEFTMGLTEEEFDKTLDRIRRDPRHRDNYGGTVTWSMLMMPAHRVRITKPFLMGACEVTVAEFRRFTEASGYKTEAEQGLDHGEPYRGGRPLSTWRKPMAWRPDYKQQDNEPVLHLCWNDCAAFCQWLSWQEGQPYCLPTEAEWEYACRAGTVTPWSFGDYDDFDRVAHEYAWWSEGQQGKHDGPRGVGLGKPNAFGLYDMHGNVWEYVADWWHEFSYKNSPLNDPAGPAEQHEKGDQRRIIRGSSFDWDGGGGNSAYRMRIGQRSNQHPHMGFRVAMRLRDAPAIAPAVDPDEQRRAERRDPGATSAEVADALKPNASATPHPPRLKIDLGGGAGMDFVLIPAGSFLMGSDRGPKDERPVHRVVISKPFYLGVHEVTQAQWEALMGVHPRLAEWRKTPNDLVGPAQPMNDLSWKECQLFLDKLRQKAPGHAFALPNEAQWEYACRAGNAAEYCFGDDESQLGQYAWYAANKRWPARDGSFHYYNVATKQPNAWGLYDMHGGVWEWCGDWYDPDYYVHAPLGDPHGPDSGRFRALRGGSWFRHGKYARSAYRRFFHPEGDGDGVTAWILDFGFRVAINLP
jgi:formylglycine-generating enzyme required for sulfatase activity